MSHTLDDLRGALAEAVDGVAGPTPEATLEGTSQHRAAASRRRRTGVAALTVAVLAAGGALATRGPEHRAGPVRPAVRTVTDGSFPTYRDGLRLVRVYDVPVGSSAQRRPLAVPPGVDGDVWVQIQCPDVPGVSLTDLSVGIDRSGPGAVSGIPQGCLSPSLARTARLELALTALAATRTIPLVVGAVPAAPAAASVRVGVYEEVPFGRYPFAQDPDASGTDLADVPQGTVVRRVDGAGGGGARPVTVTVPFASDLAVAVTGRSPGQFRVTANGVPLTMEVEGMDGPGWRDGSLVLWYPSTRSVGLKVWLTIGGRPARAGEPVTISVTPADVGPRGWSLTVAHDPDLQQ